MIEAVSCGGVVIFRGKILVLYKNYKNKYEGWVLPKGTVEAGESYEETAFRPPLPGMGERARIPFIFPRIPLKRMSTGISWRRTAITASLSGRNIFLILGIISITKRIIS